MLVCSFLSNTSHSQDITKDTIQARKYVNIADSFVIDYKLNDALSAYKLAADIYRTYNLWEFYATTQNRRGSIQRLLGNYESALKILNDLLKILHDLKCPNSACNTIMRWASR